MNTKNTELHGLTFIILGMLFLGSRLVDGPSSTEGKVEMQVDGFWLDLCDHFMSQQIADVICRELMPEYEPYVEASYSSQYEPSPTAKVMFFIFSNNDIAYINHTYIWYNVVCLKVCSWGLSFL